MTRRPRSLAALLLAVLPTAACAAPRAKPASGPVADRVQAAIASGTETFDHRAWNRLLEQGVDDGGRVDYPFFQDHRADLDAYLKAIGSVELSTLQAAQLEALLINAYNALTVASILDHPAVTTIRDIDGVWDKVKHRVGGFDLTLDEIEHTLLRPYFKDPRIHFAVNCASASCAPLPRWAFDGAELDRQLEERARRFLSDPRNVKVEGAKALLSSYFDWYGADFTAEGWKPRADSILEFVALYAADDVAKRIRSGEALGIGFLDYDWSLNASLRPRS